MKQGSDQQTQKPSYNKPPTTDAESQQADGRRLPSEYEETAPERRQRPTDTEPEGSQAVRMAQNIGSSGSRKPSGPDIDELGYDERNTVVGDKPVREDQAYQLNQTPNSNRSQQH